MEETNQIFQPVTAVPVPVKMATMPQYSETVLVELGCQKLETTMPQNMAGLPPTVASPLTTLPAVVAPSPQPLTTLSPVTNDVVMADVDGHVKSHGDLPKNGQFLPVEGGYILVEENAAQGKYGFSNLHSI